MPTGHSYDLTWTHGIVKPESYASWGDWIRTVTYDALHACEERANTPRQTIHRNPRTGYASLSDEDALRSITRAEVRSACYRYVHGSLEEYCMLGLVDWRTVMRQVEGRVTAKLQDRGYTVTYD